MDFSMDFSLVRVFYFTSEKEFSISSRVQCPCVFGFRGSLASPAKGRAFTACLLFFYSQCYYIRNKMWVGSLIRALSSPFLSPKKSEPWFGGKAESIDGFIGWMHSSFLGHTHAQNFKPQQFRRIIIVRPPGIPMRFRHYSIPYEDFITYSICRHSSIFYIQTLFHLYRIPIRAWNPHTSVEPILPHLICWHEIQIRGKARKSKEINLRRLTSVERDDWRITSGTYQRKSILLLVVPILLGFWLFVSGSEP